MRFDLRKEAISIKSKSASAKVEAKANCPEIVARIINEVGYTKQWIFNIDEATFY